MKLILKIAQAVQWRFNRLRKNRFDGWLRIYPTLRCNLRCPYCSNYVEGKNCINDYIEISTEEWLHIIKKVNRNVIISGGEPGIYPGFPELLAGIPRHLKVKVYSNMTFSPELITEKVKRPIDFLGSYHPSCKKPEKVMNCVKALAANPLFSGILHIIDTPENTEAMEQARKTFNTLPWNLSIDTDQRNLCEKTSQKFKKHVICQNKIIIIAPDGTRYPCMTKMLYKHSSLENLLTDSLKLEFPEIECYNWGSCSYCDGLIYSNTKFVE